MKSEQWFALAIGAVLNNIKAELLVSTHDDTGKLFYGLKDEDEATRLGLEPTKEGQRKLLYKLEELGAFKIEYVDHPLFTLKEQREAFDGMIVAPNTVYLHINQPRFDELLAEYSGRLANNLPSDRTIKVQLIKEDRYLSLVTENKTKNIKKFNPDTWIDELVNYLVNNRPNKSVSIYELRNAPGLHLASLDDIAETLRKAGLKPLQQHFIKEWSKMSAKVNTEAEMTDQEYESLVKQMTAKNRQK